MKEEGEVEKKQKQTWQISCEAQWEGLKGDAGNLHQNSQRAFLGIAVRMKQEPGLKLSECVMDLTARRERSWMEDGNRCRKEGGQRQSEVVPVYVEVQRGRSPVCLAKFTTEAPSTDQPSRLWETVIAE